MNRLHFIIALAFTWVAGLTHAREAGGVHVLTDIAYKQGAALTDYERARCSLAVYLPPTGKGFATLVWFHGGGLQKGDKAGTPEDSVKTPLIARSLARAGSAAGGIGLEQAAFRASAQRGHGQIIEVVLGDEHGGMRGLHPRDEREAVHGTGELPIHRHDGGRCGQQRGQGGLGVGEVAGDVKRAVAGELAGSKITDGGIIIHERERGRRVHGGRLIRAIIAGRETHAIGKNVSVG